MYRHGRWAWPSCPRPPSTLSQTLKCGSRAAAGARAARRRWPRLSCPRAAPCDQMDRSCHRSVGQLHRSDQALDDDIQALGVAVFQIDTHRILSAGSGAERTAITSYTSYPDELPQALKTPGNSTCAAPHRRRPRGGPASPHDRQFYFRNLSASSGHSFWSHLFHKCGQGRGSSDEGNVCGMYEACR